MTMTNAFALITSHDKFCYKPHKAPQLVWVRASKDGTTHSGIISSAHNAQASTASKRSLNQSNASCFQQENSTFATRKAQCKQHICCLTSTTEGCIPTERKAMHCCCSYDLQHRNARSVCSKYSKC
jgi:hypothetical protein